MTKAERAKVILEFEQYLLNKYPKWEKEISFSNLMDTKRKFRADYWIEPNPIIEINGGQWRAGRHNRGGEGYERDLGKINLAQLHRYKIYQFTYEMLTRREYTNFI